MRFYWIWFSLLAISWYFAIQRFPDSPADMPGRILGSAIFFSLFFLSPLLRKNVPILTLTLGLSSIAAIVVFWPEPGMEWNPFSLLVFSILAGKAVYRLPAWNAAIIGSILLVGALLPVYIGYPAFPAAFLFLYAACISMALVVFRKIWEAKEAEAARNEALLYEYRKMKRLLSTGEKRARQEERTQIARDIHDSVGHKLTALLMQLEVFRMQADKQHAARLQELKNLAKESLEETRSAVKNLKQDEGSGVTAIISLIRKLEAESFIRIQFSVKHGALSAQLENEQTIVIYRVVQEALTNMMRHSQAREAEVVFEAPGGRVFRFEISNPATTKVPFREGFGILSMRERIEQAGGQLDLLHDNERFIVRGTLPLHKEEREKDGSHLVSRRSADGPPRAENDD